MARWPSGLRRQTKETRTFDVQPPLLPRSRKWQSGPKGRGFESHSRQSFCFSALTAFLPPPSAESSQPYTLQSPLWFFLEAEDGSNQVGD